MLPAATKIALFVLSVCLHIHVPHTKNALRYQLCATLGQNYSLVPRPLPQTSFDRLQDANMAGEGLGDLVMCDDIR